MLIVAGVAMHGASADSQGPELLPAQGSSHYLVVLLQWDQLCAGAVQAER